MNILFFEKNFNKFLASVFGCVELDVLNLADFRPFYIIQICFTTNDSL